MTDATDTKNKNATFARTDLVHVVMSTLFVWLFVQVALLFTWSQVDWPLWMGTPGTALLFLEALFAIGAVLYGRWLWQRTRRHTLRYLGTHGWSLRECPYCSYDLRGVEGDRCPECGAPIPHSGSND